MRQTYLNCSFLLKDLRQIWKDKLNVFLLSNILEKCLTAQLNGLSGI